MLFPVQHLGKRKITKRDKGKPRRRRSGVGAAANDAACGGGAAAVAAAVGSHADICVVGAADADADRDNGENVAIAFRGVRSLRSAAAAEPEATVDPAAIISDGERGDDDFRSVRRLRSAAFAVPAAAVDKDVDIIPACYTDTNGTEKVSNIAPVVEDFADLCHKLDPFEGNCVAIDIIN